MAPASVWRLFFVALLFVGFGIGHTHAASCTASIRAPFPNPGSASGTLEITIEDSRDSYSQTVPFGNSATFEGLVCGEVSVQIWASYGAASWMQNRWFATHRVELSRKRGQKVVVPVPGVPVTIASVNENGLPSTSVGVHLEPESPATCRDLASFIFLLDERGRAQTLLCPGAIYRLEVRPNGGETQVYSNDQLVTPSHTDDLMHTYLVSAAETPFIIRIETTQTDTIPVYVGIEDSRSAQRLRLLVTSKTHNRKIYAPWNRSFQIQVPEYPAVLRPVATERNDIEFEPPEAKLPRADPAQPIKFTARIVPTFKKPGRLIGDDLEGALLQASWSKSDGCEAWLGGELTVGRDGRFEMPCKPNCRMRISVPAIGPYNPTSWTEHVTECERPIEIELERASYIEGRVVDSERQAVSGLAIGMSFVTRVTGDDGTFRIPIPDQTLGIDLWDPPTDGEDFMLVDAATGRSETYKRPEEGDLEVTLRYEQASRFCVRGPVPSSYILHTFSLDEPDSLTQKHSSYDTSDEQQACSSPLPAGLYKVRYAPSGDLMPVWWPDAYSAAEGGSVQLIAGERTQLEFPQIPAAKIELSGLGQCRFEGWTHLEVCPNTDESSAEKSPDCVYLIGSYVDSEIRRFAIPTGATRLSFVQKKQDEILRKLSLEEVDLAQGQSLKLSLKDYLSAYVEALFSPLPSVANVE